MTTLTNCRRKTIISHGDAKIVLINTELTVIKFFLKMTRIVFVVTNVLTRNILTILNYLSLNLNIITLILVLRRLLFLMPGRGEEYMLEGGWKFSAWFCRGTKIFRHVLGSRFFEILLQENLFRGITKIMTHIKHMLHSFNSW